MKIFSMTRVKTDKVRKTEKVTKINLRIISKAQHLASIMTFALTVF